MPSMAMVSKSLYCFEQSLLAVQKENKAKNNYSFLKCTFCNMTRISFIFKLIVKNAKHIKDY